jgi:beta-lactam-binding protein with PASTA domain
MSYDQAKSECDADDLTLAVSGGTQEGTVATQIPQNGTIKRGQKITVTFTGSSSDGNGGDSGSGGDTPEPNPTSLPFIRSQYLLKEF